MKEVVIVPTKVIVMADELHMYAWSDQGECLGHSGLKMVAQCFQEHPQLSEMVDVEYELWDWTLTRPATASVAERDWQDFHLQGLILARRLADLLRPLAVQVHYRCNPADASFPHLNMGPL